MCNYDTGNILMQKKMFKYTNILVLGYPVKLRKEMRLSLAYSQMWKQDQKLDLEERVNSKLVKYTEDTMFGDVANISEDKYINDLERK